MPPDSFSTVHLELTSERSMADHVPDVPAYPVSTLPPIFLPLLSLLDEGGGRPIGFRLRDFVVGMGVDWGKAMSVVRGFCCSTWVWRSRARRPFRLWGEGFVFIVSWAIVIEEGEEELGAMSRHVRLRTTLMSSVEACVTLLGRLEMKV